MPLSAMALPSDSSFCVSVSVSVSLYRPWSLVLRDRARTLYASAPSRCRKPTSRAVLIVWTSSGLSPPKCAVPTPNPRPGTIAPSDRETGAKVDMLRAESECARAVRRRRASLGFGRVGRGAEEHQSQRRTQETSWREVEE